MPLQLTIHHGLPYLLVEVSGTASLADHQGVVSLAATVCAGTRYRRCLLDLRSMETSLAFTEHLQLGTFVGENVRNLEKVATVVTPEVRSGISEKAARKTGARLRAFTCIEQATAWIHSNELSRPAELSDA
ncbi:hypothetical protein GCM10027034_04400 [Ramlibacter solisilvae]|uniref:STAS/SEC14 domain-containing protein n=1 Tax=Ramlibacter tataouinensis TaxID=94132 RepID=A0A127JYS8_9BURK|nr:STAS/SEC14 domain-containing protein [Ramlibacter tataouinensis]AMO25111.1 hypothetical protein UC35_22615 [Ramlibacter tataouinensis]